KRSLFSKKKCTKKIYLSLNKRHLEKRPLSQPFKIAGFRNLALLPDQLGLSKWPRLRVQQRYRCRDPQF
ncbi:hypothetical protein ACET9J_21025, partial [Aeromonas veronii]